MKKIILLLIFFSNIATAQKNTITADKFIIRASAGRPKAKLITSKIYALDRFYVGTDTSDFQREPFDVTTNARFGGKIKLGESYGIAGSYLKSNGPLNNPTWSKIQWSEIEGVPSASNSWVKMPVSGITGNYGLGNGTTTTQPDGTTVLPLIFSAGTTRIGEFNQYGQIYGFTRMGINIGFNNTQSSMFQPMGQNYQFIIGGNSSFGYNKDMPTAQKTGTYFLDIAKQNSNDISQIRFTKYESSGLTNVAKWQLQQGANDDFSIQKINTNGSTDTTNSIYVNSGRFNFGRQYGMNLSKFTFAGGATFTGDVIINSNKSITQMIDEIEIAKTNAANALTVSSNLVSGQTFKGNWDIAANTPSLGTTASVNGDYYLISVGGTTSITGTSVSMLTGGRIISNGTSWVYQPPNEYSSLESEIKNLKYKSYIKDKSLNFSTIEKQILTAISTLDLKVPDSQKNDDWRIKFVTTIPTTTQWISSFKYRLIIRNLTTSTDFTLINENTTFDINAINGHKFYSGTSTTGSNSIEYNIGIDWKYLLSLGSTFEYFNDNTSNLKLNIGFWEQETILEQRLKTIEPVVSLNTTNVTTNTLTISELKNSVTDYAVQAVNINNGSYVSNGGSVVSLGNKSYVEYSATSSDSIKVTTSISGNALSLAIYKNTSGSVIGTEINGINGIISTYTDFKLTIPANTATVLLNKETSFPFILKKKQIVKSASQETADYLSVQINENKNKLVSHTGILSSYVTQNLTINNGFYYSTAQIPNASFRYTSISATSSDSIIVTTKISGEAMYLATYRDVNGNINGNENIGINGQTQVYENYKLTIPANTATIYINGLMSSPIVVKKMQLIDKALNTTDLVDVTSKVTTLESEMLNLKFSEYVKDKYLNFSTKEKQILTAISTLDLKVPDSQKNDDWRINFVATIPATSGFVSAFKYRVMVRNFTTNTDFTIINENATFDVNSINGRKFYSGTSTTGSNSIEYNIGIDWKYLLSLGSTFEYFVNSTSNNLKVNIGFWEQETILDKRVKALEGSITPSQWTGKTILWLGTSIPEGGRYPTDASAKLGATCINKAVGSSMMRIAKSDGTINGLAWQNICYALCHTNAQKQELIDNWETYRTVLGNSPPTSLSSTEQAKILSCSYENRLLPYLNGTNTMPDLFVIDHGHNDNLSSDTDAQFTEQPSERTNKNTFLGSMNFIIDLILQYNPRARIFFIGHYENARKTRISIAQTNIAEKWDFPFLPLWKYTGFTQEKVPNSAYLWAVPPYSAYSAGQDTSQNLTVTRVYMPDDLHPHTDTSLRTQTLLTNIVYQFLLSNY